MMKISVVIPTFQSERFISELLQSIISQTLKPNEIIISDDASTDHTLQIIQELTNYYDCDVRIYHHQPNGITSNYLNAIKYASGDIILVSDHDDVWALNRVEVIVKYFSHFPQCVLVSSDSLIVNENLCSSSKTLRGDSHSSARLCKKVNSSLEKSIYSFIKGEIPLLAHTLAFRKDLIAHLKAKPDHIENWFFEEWVTSMAFCYGDIILVPEYLTLYRQHSNQVAGFTHPKVFNKVLPLKKKHDYYVNRLQKIEFMLSKLKSINRYSPAIEMKIQALLSYSICLRKRKSFVVSLRFLLKIYKIYQATLLLLKGQYHQFFNGFKSYVYDLYIILS